MRRRSVAAVILALLLCGPAALHADGLFGSGGDAGGSGTPIPQGGPLTQDLDFASKKATNMAAGSDIETGFLLDGSSSGHVTVQVSANAGTYNFNLPVTAGTAGYALVSGGGGSTAMTWAQMPLVGTTGAIGGSPLLVGQCAEGTASVTGATSSMAVGFAPSSDPDSSLSAGVSIYAFVSAAGTVKVRVCALATVTPAAVTYNVRAIP